jgi:hypothetical protein
MAKHTDKEILAHFQKESGNTHEGAVLSAYNLGYGQGEADVKERAVHKDPALAKEILEKRDAEAAAGDPEATHEQLEARKRELADQDDETPEEAAASGSTKRSRGVGGTLGTQKPA